MGFTKEEIFQLIIMTNVFRNDRERQLRKTRRNLNLITENYESLPDGFADENGIISPECQMRELKEEKAIAVILKKKLELQLTLTK